MTRTSLLIRMKLETWDQNVNFNNGKRKNECLLYTQRPWRGETGSDISGIPIDAIKDIQVLRRRISNTVLMQLLV
jgi:hypothetical protein